MINKLIPGILRKFFTFSGGYKGDNRLSTINDINNIVDQINLFSARESTVITVTQPLPGGPILNGELACNCESGTGSCPSCCVKPCAYKCKSNVSILETGPGIYDFVVTVNPNTTYYGAYLTVGNLSVINTGVTVEQTAPYTFRVVIYDNVTGIATSGIFKNTIVEVVLLVTNPAICTAP